MNITIVSSLGEIPERQNALVIGTHPRTFHCDELVACATLCLLNPHIPIYILRTRDDIKSLSQCDICVDVGGGEYDHHQAGFNKSRKNGIKYASAGLVWKSYGKQLIKLISEKYFSGIKCNIDSIFIEFDANCISLVDCEDNGKKADKHCFSFITSFLPLWFDNDFDRQFKKALICTIDVLEEELKSIIGKGIASSIIIPSRWNNENYFNNGILELPSQTIDWLEAVVSFNSISTKTKRANFVIFPYPDGGWAAQCVPPSMENKFGQIIPFPAEWAGQTDKLAEISGIQGSTRCHNGRFFARATSKKAIIQMCTIATTYS